MQIFFSREKAPLAMKLTVAPILAAPLLLASTPMVMAQSQVLPNRDACWERIYDDAHLKAHPMQQVVRIRLFHLPSRWPQPASGVTFVALEINLRTRTRANGRVDYSLGGFASRAKAGCAASRNGARGRGGSKAERMEGSSSATVTSPSIRPHPPQRSGRKTP